MYYQKKQKASSNFSFIFIGNCTLRASGCALYNRQNMCQIQGLDAFASNLAVLERTASLMEFHSYNRLSFQ